MAKARLPVFLAIRQLKLTVMDRFTGYLLQLTSVPKKGMLSCYFLTRLCEEFGQLVLFKTTELNYYRNNCFEMKVRLRQPVLCA